MHRRSRLMRIANPGGPGMTGRAFAVAKDLAGSGLSLLVAFTAFAAAAGDSSVDDIVVAQVEVPAADEKRDAVGIESPSPMPSATSDWIVYGSPEIGLYAHTGKGSSIGTPLTGPRVTPIKPFGDLGPNVQEQERSRELIAAFLAGVTVGALTPSLDIPSRPRAFIDVNISWPQTTEAQLARQGNPGPLAFPDGPAAGRPLVTEGALVGRGTQISAQLQGPQVHAGLGLSVEFPIPGDQLIRVKTAAVYSRTILDIQAQTVRGVRLTNDQGTNQVLADDFRQIVLSDERTEVYHAAGPSLELEYMPGIELGPFSVAIYGRGHASHIFNTLETEMRQCNIAGGQPNECVNWEYTQDRWAYRATFGFRLSWSPRSQP